MISNSRDNATKAIINGHIQASDPLHLDMVFVYDYIFERVSHSTTKEAFDNFENLLYNINEPLKLLEQQNDLSKDEVMLLTEYVNLMTAFALN